MDPKKAAAAHASIEASLDQQNMRALHVYANLLVRMGVRTLGIYRIGLLPGA